MLTWDELTDVERYDIRSLWVAEDERRNSFATMVLGEADEEVKTWWESLTDTERSELYHIPLEAS